MSPALIVGLVGALAGAAIELSAHSYRSVNGAVTDCSYFNASPVIFGPVAVVAGLIAVARAGRPDRRAERERLLGLLFVVVGIVHVLGAFELLGSFDLVVSDSPC